MGGQRSAFRLNRGGRVSPSMWIAQRSERQLPIVPALHEEQQRQDDEGDHHHQLEIVEIGDEQRLPGDLGVDVGERGGPADRDRGSRMLGSRSASCSG